MSTCAVIIGSDYFLDILEFLLEMYSLFEELKKKLFILFFGLFLTSR